MNHTVKVWLCSRVVLELMQGLKDHGFELHQPTIVFDPLQKQQRYYDYKSTKPLLAEA